MPAGNIVIWDRSDSELAKAGFTVEKRDIALGQPLKALGSEDVEIRLDADVTATIQVNVVKDEA